jgi:hypothetical protein
MKLIPLVAAALLAATGAAQTCTFTNFGPACGGDLAGSLVRGPALQFDVSNADPGSLAVLVAGEASRPGHALPGTNCLLYVFPRHHLGPVQVDRAGNATFLVRLPHLRAFDIDFQVATLGTTRNHRVIESTNGVNVVCR